MVVRQAVAADIPSLLALERASDGAPHWSMEAWGDIVHGGEVQRMVFVADDEGVAGFIVVSLVADVAELESIVVASEARRQGLARALCERSIRWARENGAAGMELEVRAGNMTALRLYLWLGFVEQGHRARYYSNPVEDAVLMRLEF